MNYFQHNDETNKARREAVAVHNAERARMLTACAEYTLGDVTLFLPAYAQRSRMQEARILSGGLGVRS